MNQIVAKFLDKVPEELQVPIGITISLVGMGLLFVLICGGLAILKLSGVL
jgi:hypothetical protein